MSRARRSAYTPPVPCSSAHPNGASTMSWSSPQVRLISCLCTPRVAHSPLIRTEEYMHQITVIEPKWLSEVAPTFFRVADQNRISKRKANEKIEPLYDRFAADKDDWVRAISSCPHRVLMSVSVSASKIMLCDHPKLSVRVHPIGSRSCSNVLIRHPNPSEQTHARTARFSVPCSRYSLIHGYEEDIIRRTASSPYLGFVIPEHAVHLSHCQDAPWNII